MTSNDDHDTTVPDDDRDPIAGLLDRLGGDATLVRRTAFTRLRATAAPVDVATLAAECDLTLHEVETALSDLVSAGAITRSPAGAVVAVGGLSVVPARHHLRLDGQQYWTWCAFDGIGIPAALEVDAVVETRCPTCGRALVVPRRGRSPTRGQPGRRMAARRTLRERAGRLLPEANLFCDATHLAAWGSTGDHEGAPASLVELTDTGKATWADIT
ncbi:organomercurial lyase [uncultured Nocardioides sp.]|uniref:organomercurial lyase n=1 Tax=uncultured Nocardioides sp. TaxID=198441 RepID=UPI0026288773|nr:organomercurial lyase [uncultured Nocardioides sp.]